MVAGSSTAACPACAAARAGRAVRLPGVRRSAACFPAQNHSRAPSEASLAMTGLDSLLEEFRIRIQI